MTVKETAKEIKVEKSQDPKQKKNLRYLRDKDREKVRGIFRFYEVPGGTMSFVFRAYKEDDVERYDFVDGQIYTVPLGVAKHLNKNCWYPVHRHHQDEMGKVSSLVGKKVRRVGFQSLEFIDPEEIGEAPVFAPVDVSITSL
jgi:hypothetical protein